MRALLLIACFTVAVLATTKDVEYRKAAELVERVNKAQTSWKVV
jgi:hypothetical protein